MGLFEVEVGKMMHVAGDVRYALPESINLVEDAVHAHLTELLLDATTIVRRRGRRSIQLDDILFLVRRNPERLLAVLTWRKVRRAALSAQEEELSLVDESRMPWEVDVGTKEETPPDYRLLLADEITKGMSQDEYMAYAECRQASFTYKHPKRFRDWLAVDSLVSDIKLGTDVIDMLGFLGYEWVCGLTEQALFVKQQMELYQERSETGQDAVVDRVNLAVQEQCVGLSIFTQADDRVPLQPIHILEACRRLQTCKQPFHTGLQRRRCR
jgi:transcription initiation protein SPT3